MTCDHCPNTDPTWMVTDETGTHCDPWCCETHPDCHRRDAGRGPVRLVAGDGWGRDSDSGPSTGVLTASGHERGQDDSFDAPTGTQESA